MSTIRKVMDDHPLTCTPETDVNEVRRMMLEHHVRYPPVLESRTLMGVISFYDVAKAVVEEQGFENRMLKAYIRDWPEEQQEQQPWGVDGRGDSLRRPADRCCEREKAVKARAKACAFLCPALSSTSCPFLCPAHWPVQRPTP